MDGQLTLAKTQSGHERAQGINDHRILESESPISIISLSSNLLSTPCLNHIEYLLFLEDAQISFLSLGLCKIMVFPSS